MEKWIWCLFLFNLSGLSQFLAIFCSKFNIVSTFFDLPWPKQVFSFNQTYTAASKVLKHLNSSLYISIFT